MWNYIACLLSESTPRYRFRQMKEPKFTTREYNKNNLSGVGDLDVFGLTVTKFDEYKKVYQSY